MNIMHLIMFKISCHQAMKFLAVNEREIFANDMFSMIANNRFMIEY